MQEKQIKLVIGSLLHDIGKVIFRTGNMKTHSQSGYEYLRDVIGIKDEEILNCVRYHHAKELNQAKISEKSLAYLTYYADNVASATDRREKEELPEGGMFDRNVPLSSVFNLLNGNQENYHYAEQILDDEGTINYPQQQQIKMTKEFYKKVLANITENLRGISFTEEYLNSLLAVLEANLSYVPSSTEVKEVEDISLFDHVKITAGVAQCIQQYLEEEKEPSYKKKLYTKAKACENENMFLLYSMDISGIQKFIYTINSSGALKGLRARSFYLEILMEHMADELLTALSLSRANLIYTGGGHCYMILPNTCEARMIIEEQEQKVNQWFLQTFDTALYVASAYVPCSLNNLQNVPEGSYSGLYRTISRTIASKKTHRYDAGQIRYLNSRKRDGERECIICRRTGKVNSAGKCKICDRLEKISSDVIHQDFFVVTKLEFKDSLPLPGERYLSGCSQDGLTELMESEQYVRAYSKNKIFTGKHVATKLWVGDYTTEDSFEELAQKAKGIKRIGILRADVDNLGQTLINGFYRKDVAGRYITISRTATLSRQLSLFFKFYINKILRDKKRDVMIVYSGGDDIFLAGAWNDVLNGYKDIRVAFAKFTQRTLTISAGVGIYHAGYPINIMAREVEELEKTAKQLKEKDGITLFEKSGVYPWRVYMDRVINEKHIAIQYFFRQTEGYGKAFLYKLLELLRGTETINRARYVYLLSRMEPGEDASPEQREAYKTFANKMYGWIEGENRRELVTAIYIYVYFNREEEEK